MNNLSKENLSKKDLVLIGLMLFSLFFGAGNLIFPPFMGEAAGEKTWIVLLGFFITAVGFPVLGVIAVAKSGGLTNLAKRVNPVFATVFTVLIYLSIGPGLGIPRAGSLPFEMAVAPYLPESVSLKLALFLYTLVFFSVAYWLSLSPSKLVDRMGKILTPALLALILIMVAGSFVKPLGSYEVAVNGYETSSFFKGFLDGYLTMDTIAALNFGIVIALAIKSKGVTDEKKVVKLSIKAGVMAGGLLAVIYAMLAHLGATSRGMFGVSENGAQTLTNVTTYIFGKPGAVLLALIFTLACLTTCIGLITSCSQYFTTLSEKISYEKWVAILSVFSLLSANMGLTKILSISVPILNAIYPIAIMLIVLAMLDFIFKGSKYIYGLTILLTGVVSVIDSLGQVGMKIDILTNMIAVLPLYKEGLSWLAPAILGIVLGLILKFIKDENISTNRDFEGQMSN
ncbi:branched-chain amino acid transport system II carrier protein [Clostridium sp. Sa3CUN1]|uniref:Branched-chain amino acid transport system carrier protein n=1 Tax=Clostridium gallinarum TaxID=2762246 RepID=A0ABR8Q1X5_9CLOT|nr:branched-chain amino acid transport system II carrier protein [Clostridium gallinarum]MBD7914425.1 branched-chain amino acid transport system II carrier protein [Clostridium gallinarum]